jgi:hypothetical protein
MRVHMSIRSRGSIPYVARENATTYDGDGHVGWSMPLLNKINSFVVFKTHFMFPGNNFHPQLLAY